MIITVQLVVFALVVLFGMINSQLRCIILYIYIYIYEMLDVVVMSVVLAEFALNNYGQIDYDLNAFRSLHEWVKVM